MKILYIVNSTEMGGGIISLLNLLSGLRAKEVDIIVVGPRNPDSEFTSALTTKGIRYIPSIIPKEVWPGFNVAKDVYRFFIYLYRMLRDIRIGDKLFEQIIKEEKPDIVHSNYGVVHLGYRICKRLGIPHVWHIREYQDLDFKWIPFPSMRKMKDMYKDGNHIVTITRDLATHFSLDNYSKHITIYNGIFSEKDITRTDNREKIFLCASRIDPAKGFEDVLDAFSIFVKEHSDYKLQILGFGYQPYIDSLQQRAERLGIAKHILWEGYKPDVKPYMLHAKALIVGSHSEGFGRMTAEASMLGLIPIGRNTGGTHEIISNTGGYEFNNVNEMADAMKRVAELPDDNYQTLSRNIQEKAIDKYSTEQNVRKMLELYNSILQNK